MVQRKTKENEAKVCEPTKRFPALVIKTNRGEHESEHDHCRKAEYKGNG